MWDHIATARQALWAFVELAFLVLLAIVLVHLLLGQAAGTYIASVADNVTKFATATSSGLIGVIIILALIYLAARRGGLKV